MQASRRDRVTVTVRGQVQPMQQMFGGLRSGLLVAVVVIFLMLAANFQSLRLSLAVVAHDSGGRRRRRPHACG